MTPWQIVSEILKAVALEVKPGVTTNYLNEVTEKKIKEFGVKSFNKGYHPNWAREPFPTVLCTSVNNQIAHGIPSEYILKEGDIINLDLGIVKDGVCGDAGLMVPVGTISNRDERLLRYAKRTLYVGINQIRAGAIIKTIGEAMETYANIMGFQINSNLSGHGIGQEMHQEPLVPSCRIPGLGEDVLKAGDMICLEPMLTYKDRRGRLAADGWTWVTADGKKSAQFEHQILVKEGGYEILTSHLEE